jgi:hypothetical protein
MGNYISSEYPSDNSLPTLPNLRYYGIEYLPKELFVGILKLCNCKTFVCLVRTNKTLREKYMLNSEYMLKYIEERKQKGDPHELPGYNLMYPSMLVYLDIANILKLEIENKIKDNNGDHILISSLKDFNNPYVFEFQWLFNENKIQKIHIRIFNIIDSLIKDKYKYRITLRGQRPKKIALWEKPQTEILETINFPCESINYDKKEFYGTYYEKQEKDRVTYYQIQWYSIWVEPVRNFMSYLF